MGRHPLKVIIETAAETFIHDISDGSFDIPDLWVHLEAEAFHDRLPPTFIKRIIPIYD